MLRKYFRFSTPKFPQVCPLSSMQCARAIGRRAHSRRTMFGLLLAEKVSEMHKVVPNRRPYNKMFVVHEVDSFPIFLQSNCFVFVIGVNSALIVSGGTTGTAKACFLLKTWKTRPVTRWDVRLVGRWVEAIFRRVCLNSGIHFNSSSNTVRNPIIRCHGSCASYINYEVYTRKSRIFEKFLFAFRFWEQWSDSGSR